MRILVTYDGSTASGAVFAPAGKLARETGAEVVLLRVHQPPLDLVAHPDANYRARGLEAIEASWLADLEEAGPAIGSGTQCVIRRLGHRWNVVDEILGVASELGVDMIMMATHGESALRHFVVGSTALDVLSKSACPVLLVRSGEDPSRRSVDVSHAQSPDPEQR